METHEKSRKLTKKQKNEKNVKQGEKQVKKQGLKNHSHDL